MKPKALFVNPPSAWPFMRDYYCTSVAKARYAWHPAEFLFQSAYLSERYDIEILDAVAQGLSADAARRRGMREPVDLLFGLVGAGDPEADLDFLRHIPARLRAVSGEVVQPDAAGWLAGAEGIDAAMSDFSSDGLTALAEGREQGPGIAIRRGDSIAPAAVDPPRVFSLPRPRHELFVWTAYRMPLQRHRPFASFLTDYGCPWDCAFCNTGTLRYRRRTAESLSIELDALERMGFRELFVKDMSFGAHKAHARMVTDLLDRDRFTWHTYARIEDLDAALIAAMAGSGCHLVQVGVEHCVPEILAPAGKPYGPEDIRRVVGEAHVAGIDVGLHCVLGLPGETPSTLRELEHFLADLDTASYLSVNLYAPRRGSRMDRAAPAAGERPHDTSRGSDAAALSRGELEQARRRIYRRFYLSPRRAARLVRLTRIGEAVAGARRLLTT